MKFQWCPTGCEGGSGIGRTQWRSYHRGKSWGLPRLWWHHCQGEVRWEVGMWKWSSNDDNFYFSPIPCIKEPFWPLDSFFCLINLVKGAKVLPPLPGHSSHFNTLSVCFSSHTKMPYTGWLKKQAFISHISRGGEVQDQGGKGSLPGLQTATLLPYLHMADWISEIPGVFYKGTNPNTRAPPPWLHLKIIIPQWSHLSSTIILDVRASTFEFWGDTIQIIIFLQLFLRKNFKHI